MKNVKMNYVFFALLIGFACVSFGACSQEQSAAEKYDLAAFEEQQFNSEHATKLYNEIIEKYPDTETAVKARKALERLSTKKDKFDGSN